MISWRIFLQFHLFCNYGMVWFRLLFLRHSSEPEGISFIIYYIIKLGDKYKNPRQSPPPNVCLLAPKGGVTFQPRPFSTLPSSPPTSPLSLVLSPLRTLWSILASGMWTASLELNALFNWTKDHDINKIHTTTPPTHTYTHSITCFVVSFSQYFQTYLCEHKHTHNLFYLTFQYVKLP